MNVLIISTTEKTGGGAIAARRLMEALNRNGVNARMLVRDKQTDSPNVVNCGNIVPKVLERLELMMKLRMPCSRTWPYDTADFGIDILDTPEYKNADDLAKGIRWALDAAPEQMCSNATRKVAQEYSQSVVAKEYIEVYNEAMALKNYKL